MTERKAPTIEDAAIAKAKRVLAEQTSHSVFDERGKLDERRLAGGGQLQLGEYLDLASVPFAPDPDGSDHCIHLARLAEYMTTLTDRYGGFGPFNAHDGRVLHAVAILYCTGKAHGHDDGYAARSAKLADDYFRNGGGCGTYWSKDTVREETCRLIYKHLQPDEVRVDKRLQLFNDARRYELVRLNPNTKAGIELLQVECAPEKFYTGWAKTKENFRAYMKSRGWR